MGSSANGQPSLGWPLRGRLQEVQYRGFPGVSGFSGVATLVAEFRVVRVPAGDERNVGGIRSQFLVVVEDKVQIENKGRVIRSKKEDHKVQRQE
jgi:hypothetical protein